MNYYIMKNSKYYIFIAGITLFLFILAYVLITTIDKTSDVTIDIYLTSLYSTFTQFGSFLLPIFIIYYINMDYREKNSLFLLSLNYNSIKFYISKIFALLLVFLSFIWLFLVAVCFVFNDFSYIFSMFGLLVNVITYIIIVGGIIGYLFKNVIMAYVINIFLWLTMIIISISYSKLYFLGYYDQSSKLTKHAYNYIFGEHSINIQSIISQGIIYNCTILAFCLIICIMFKSRFLKNGV